MPYASYLYAAAITMTSKLPRERLLQLLDKLMHPKDSGLTTEQRYDEILNEFCAGCPDPVKARWLVVECLDPMTDEEIVERALRMPFRSMADVPASEFPSWHPLRTQAD